MNKFVEPRKHPVPAQFADYVAKLEPGELSNWSISVHEHLQSGMSPEAVAEISAEDGWDKELSQWLAHFTYAQRRPVIPMIEEVLVLEKLLAEDRSYRKWGQIWGCAYFSSMLTFPFISPFGFYYGFSALMLGWLFGALYCGYRFFCLWAERERKSLAYAWLAVVLPLSVLFALAFLMVMARS